MPVVTLVIRWWFCTNYAPTLRMEAVKAPDMSEQLCQTMGRRILEQRNPLRKERKLICNLNLRLKSLFLRIFKFSQMRQLIDPCSAIRRHVDWLYHCFGEVYCME